MFIESAFPKKILCARTDYSVPDILLSQIGTSAYTARRDRIWDHIIIFYFFFRSKNNEWLGTVYHNTTVIVLVL